NAVDVLPKILGQVLLYRGVKLEDPEPRFRAERLGVHLAEVLPVQAMRTSRDPRDEGAGRFVPMEGEGPSGALRADRFGRDFEEHAGFGEHIEPARAVR